MNSSLHIMTSTSCGGLELYVVTLIKEMAAAGMPVSALVSKKSRFAAGLIDAGVDVHFAHSEKKLDWRDIRTIRKIVRDSNCSVVHSHTRIDVWRASLALMGDHKRKHVHSVYMVVAPKRDILHRIIYGRVDAILSSSTFSNARIRECFPVPPDSVYLVRYGRHLEQYRRDDALRSSMRRRFGVSDDDLVFGMIGRTDVQKGVREFAESMSMLGEETRKRCHYFIIGEPTVIRVDANGNAVFEAQAAELEGWLQVFASTESVAGHLHILPFQKEILPYYGMLDCLVLASYAEMYSLSVIDAMSMALPVIGTDAEGTPEQVRDGITGYLVQPRSASAIAEAVEKYASYPSLLKIHGAEGAAFVRREHDFRRTLDSIEEIYDALLEGSEAGHESLPEARLALH